MQEYVTGVVDSLWKVSRWFERNVANVEEAFFVLKTNFGFPSYSELHFPSQAVFFYDEVSLVLKYTGF